MTNTQIAQKFAEGKTTGKANSMFIDGNTIFSYGYHFPIARITEKEDENGKKIALFTNRGYSNTTAKHKNHVWSALYQAGYRVITCDVSNGRVDAETVELLNKEIEDFYGKEKRARKEHMREFNHSQAEKLSEDVATLRQAFSL